MSLHSSILMIEGNHLESLTEVFSRFSYNPTKSPEIIKGWNNALDAIRFPTKGKPRTIVYKAACTINNWTVILDPEMLLVNDEDACMSVSQVLNSRLFGMICEGTSNTYAYIFCNGEMKRSFWIGDGEIFKDSGDKQAEEPSTKEVSESHILETMARIGVNYESLASVIDFHVYEFDESGLATNNINDNTDSKQLVNKKAWWRFW